MSKIFIVFGFSMTFCLTIFSQPKNVTDYFLAMPDDLYATTLEGKKITDKKEREKFRKSFIKIEDTKNGYLRLEGAWEGWAEIVLFKKPDGSYIVAHSGAQCGPGCEGFVKFWTYKNGKWTEITKQVFAEISKTDAAKAFNSRKPAGEESAESDSFSFYYLLPRYGKTLKVACNTCTDEGNDFVFMQFDWNGTKFVRKLNWK